MRAPSEPEELDADRSVGPAPPPPATMAGTGSVDDPFAYPIDGEVDATPSWFFRSSVQVASWIAVAQGTLTVAVVVGCALFVLAQLQFDLLLSDTTPAGGDMGAHTWSPAYLRDHLLPKGRLSGWTPDWYAGFPAMQFYMVVPMLAIVALSYVVPYGVAFKLVTVSGIVSLPVSAYLFGRLTRQPFPVPAFFAMAATAFVFDRSFSIYGGNAASTLAGEFAFSISLSLALLTLGVVGRGVAEGSHRVLGAVMIALTALCHLIPTFFAMAGIAVWALIHVGRDLYEGVGSLAPDRWRQFAAATRGRATWMLTVGPVAFLLAAFWIVPFYLKSRYLNDMGWGKEEKYTDFLFWREQLGTGGLADYPTLTWVIALAILGTVLAFGLRNRVGLLFFGTALIAANAFYFLPQGRLWNTRVLPFWYLSLLMLAALALALLPQMLGRPRLRRGVGWAALGSAFLLQLGLVFEPRSLPHFEVMTWGDRWEAYVFVAIAVVTLVAAAELVDTPAPTRRRIGWALAGVTAALVVILRIEPDVRTGTRLLGWTCALLALVAVVALTDLLDAARRDEPRPAWISPALRLGGSVLVLGAMWLYLALPLHSLGILGRDITVVDEAAGTSEARYSLLGIERLSSKDDSFVDSWAAWNYRGYEATCPDNDMGDCGRGRKPYWPEYHAVVETMRRVGEEHGCGRAMWEYNSELDRYGTPMALMLLPHWTDGCIGSMEGLYFEASTTTPYHFINQDEVSENGSNAQRGMPYGAGAPTEADFDRGIQHLQMLGVRYYMAYTPLMAGFARSHPDLTEVATSPSMCLPEGCPEGIETPPDRWVIFEIADSELVEPLVNEPVVLTDVGHGHTCETAPVEEDPRGRICEGWLDPAVDWYVDPTLWDVALAESGPDGWARVPVDEWLATHEAPATPLPEVTVRDISSDDDEISFTVDQVGVPVVVKTSYFPNWKVEGADGPYRITPNLMVVVPTENDVRLHYGWVGIDYLAWGLTALGLIGLVLLWRGGPVTIPAGPVAAWHGRPRSNRSDDEWPLDPPEADDIAGHADPLGPLDDGLPRDDLPPDDLPRDDPPRDDAVPPDRSSRPDVGTVSADRTVSADGTVSPDAASTDAGRDLDP